MTETQKINGLILLDAGRTLDKMPRDYVERILELSAENNCKVIIATGGEYHEGMEPLVQIGMPQDKWPMIYPGAEKKEVLFYQKIALSHAIPIDRCILIDDDGDNVASAQNSGAQSLKYRNRDGSHLCFRYLSGDPWEVKSFGEAMPLFETLREVISGWGSKRPVPKEEASVENPPAVS